MKIDDVKLTFASHEIEGYGNGAPINVDFPLRRGDKRSLPKERESTTVKFKIAGQTCYLTVGHYEDGTPGELFMKMSKQGSTVAGFLDSCAILASLGLQYGVPLEVICTKLAHVRFAPSGATGDPNMPVAHSVLDYLARWLARRYLSAKAVETATEAPSIIAAEDPTT